MSEEIILNGKRYRSPSEMPPEIQQVYEQLERLFEDRNQDGTPDLFEQGGLAGLGSAFGTIKEIASLAKAGQLSSDGQLSLIKISDFGISVNGKHFHSPAEMPAQIREIYQQAVENAQDGGEGIFAESWRPQARERYFEPHDDENLQRTAPAVISTEVESSNTRLFVLVIGALVLLSILGAALWISGLIF
ncbi:MAG: hypothetical protein JW862_01220 [Anaerolineales bacterium]|nr:hypothetical protein [Anaerolineales bacterium]